MKVIRRRSIPIQIFRFESCRDILLVFAMGRLRPEWVENGHSISLTLVTINSLDEIVSPDLTIAL